jgi:hypothetical protein
MFAGGLFVYVGTAEKNGKEWGRMEKNGVGHDISGIIRTLSSQ